MERMTGISAGESQLGRNREQRVRDGYDGDGLDRFLEAFAPSVAPAGDERAISELAHGDGCQEDLVPRHLGDPRLEPLSATPAERGAEDAGVYDDPQESRAVANASSSSSDSSSIRSVSMDVRTGAAAS